MFASQSSQRRQKDLLKLMLSKYDVKIEEGNDREFSVVFAGPKDSLYEGGVWNIRVYLPEQYPFKSPSVGFVTKIFHPNVDETSGTVCLDVLNQTWSPIYELTHVFDVFLPQLLMYPNPIDPLNGNAAALLISDPEKFRVKVKEYVTMYANNPELLERAKRQLKPELTQAEEIKENSEENLEADGELSPTSLDSEDED